MRLGDLIVGNQNWVALDFVGVAGRGRVTPRLVLSMTMRTPTERIEAELHNVGVQVLFKEEVVAEGRLIGDHVTWSGNSCQLEASTSRQALDYITDQLGAHDAIELVVRYGLLRVRWDRRDGDSPVGFPSEIKSGEWTFLHMAERQNEHHIRVARSDWFSNVLRPIGDGEVVHLEVLMPQGPEAAHWRRTLDLVAEAEKSYVLGDDSGVFAKLRGAFEALPGAPKNIFDRLPEPKRGEVDGLVKAFAARYLHYGRHVNKIGPQAGEFAVDHLDAGFALATAKVTLSYISRILDQERSSP